MSKGIYFFITLILLCGVSINQGKTWNREIEQYSSLENIP